MKYIVDSVAALSGYQFTLRRTVLLSPMSAEWRLLRPVDFFAGPPRQVPPRSAISHHYRHAAGAWQRATYQRPKAASLHFDVR